MNLDYELKKVPSAWLKNKRVSEAHRPLYTQTTTSLARPSLSPIRKSDNFNLSRNVNASFTPESRLFDATQKHSFMNESKAFKNSQLPARRQGDLPMVQPSMNASRSFLNQSINENRLNKSVLNGRPSAAKRFNSEGEIREIVDNRIQILDTVRNRLKSKRKYNLAALLVLIVFIDYVLISVLKHMIDGEQLRGQRTVVPFYLPIDSNVYFAIGYKIVTYFLVLKLTIDTEFYQLGTREAIKKLVSFNLYPVLGCVLGAWLIYLQTSIWYDVFTPSLNSFANTLLKILCLAVFIKTAVFALFSAEGKRHSDFTKRSPQDFVHYMYKKGKSALQFAFFSLAACLLVVKYLQTTEPRAFAYNPISTYDPSAMFYVKALIFLIVYCYLSFEFYLFLARVFLVTDFKNYFPNYKNLKTVLRLYHELQVDSYDKDLDKYIIEGHILNYLRDNVSVIYNNCFKAAKGADGRDVNNAEMEIHWRIMTLIFALEMKQVDEIFVRAARGRNAKKFDWIDSIINFYDFVFVNDKFTEAYLLLNARFEHLRLKFELIKELFIFSHQDNDEKGLFDETHQLYKHLKSVYENMLRFLTKFADVKTNYQKKDIIFVFEVLILGLEDLLQKVCYCVDGTSFKGNLMYN